MPITVTSSVIINIIFKDEDVLYGYNKQQFAKLLCLVIQDNVCIVNVTNYLSKLVVWLWGALLAPILPIFSGLLRT